MRARFLLAATALLATVGCYRVRPVWSPEEFLAEAKPAEVHVRLRNLAPMRSVLSVANPSLSGDTLRGTGPDGDSVAVAWADVVDVYARQIDGTRTAFAVSFTTLLSGLVVYSLVQDSHGAPGPSTCVIPPGAYDHDLDPDCAR